MKRLIENVAFLYVVHASNYLIPLVTIPFLTSRLGIAGYGDYVMAIAICVYFIILTDFGFNLSTTREISLTSIESPKISKIISSTLVAKSILLLICLVIASILYFALKNEYNWIKYIYIPFLNVVAAVITPLWYYQGTEQLKLYSIFQLIPKLLQIPLILILVQNSGDVVLALSIISFTNCLTGTLCMFHIFSIRSIPFVIPSRIEIVNRYKSSTKQFYSIASTTFLLNSGLVLLGIFSSTKQVAIYSVAEKLIRPFQNAINPMYQSLYPYLTKAYNRKDTNKASLLLKVTAIQGSIVTLMSITLFFASDALINSLFGTEFSASISIFKILAFIPMAVGFSNVFGIQTLLPLGLNKQFMTSILIGGVVNITLVALFTKQYGGVAIAFSLLTAEAIIAVLMLIQILNTNEFKKENYLG